MTYETICLLSLTVSIIRYCSCTSYDVTPYDSFGRDLELERASRTRDNDYQLHTQLQFLMNPLVMSIT